VLVVDAVKAVQIRRKGRAKGKREGKRKRKGKRRILTKTLGAIDLDDVGHR